MRHILESRAHGMQVFDRPPIRQRNSRTSRQGKPNGVRPAEFRLVFARIAVVNPARCCRLEGAYRISASLCRGGALRIRRRLSQESVSCPESGYPRRSRQRPTTSSASSGNRLLSGPKVTAN